MNADNASDVPASQYLIAVRQSEQVRERAERAEAERDAALDLLREVYELAWKNDEAPWRERVAALLSTRTPRETP